MKYWSLFLCGFISGAISFWPDNVFAGENAILVDIKSPLAQKVAIEPALEALRSTISEDSRFKVVAEGCDWKIWLQDYNREDNGASYSVNLTMSLVHPSAPDRASPVATRSVSYDFAKEPRDVLTTDDSLGRFVRGKINDKVKEFKAERTAAAPAIDRAFHALISAMVDHELKGTKNLRFRSQSL
jgi:hypothetical protein